MDDTIVLPKWSYIEPHLREAGVLTTKVSNLHKIQLARWIQSNIDIPLYSLNKEMWQEIADEFLEEHPSWASTKHIRRQHAEALLDGWQSGVYDVGRSVTVEDLVEHQYAVVSWYGKNTIVYSAGDTYKDICEMIYDLHYSAETPEFIEFYVDLNTGDHHPLFGRDHRVKTVVSITLHGETYTHESE